MRIVRLPDSGLTVVRVGAMRRVVIALPEYLAHRGEPRTPADLSEHDAIGFSQTGGTSAPWTFHAGSERIAAQPRMQLVSNLGEVGIEAALRGRGLSRALQYQVDADVQAGRLRIVLADYEPEPVPVHLVYVAGRKAPAKVRSFVDFAVERLRKVPVLSPRTRSY